MYSRELKTGILGHSVAELSASGIPVSQVLLIQTATIGKKREKILGRNALYGFPLFAGQRYLQFLDHGKGQIFFQLIKFQQRPLNGLRRDAIGFFQIRQADVDAQITVLQAGDGAVHDPCGAQQFSQTRGSILADQTAHAQSHLLHQLLQPGPFHHRERFDLRQIGDQHLSEALLQRIDLGISAAVDKVEHGHRMVRYGGHLDGVLRLQQSFDLRFHLLLHKHPQTVLHLFAHRVEGTDFRVAAVEVSGFVQPALGLIGQTKVVLAGQVVRPL
ncbi:MAG: hypothetical protein BWY83_01197 [bacterium ADurb.Bin478]|nr:MAG: hypothetical protein BWY83_01197 [bacterium ADurb.Bin478]